MQATNEQLHGKTTQIVAFLIYLIGGLMIFLWGANTFQFIFHQ